MTLIWLRERKFRIILDSRPSQQSWWLNQKLTWIRQVCSYNRVKQKFTVGAKNKNKTDSFPLLNFLCLHCILNTNNNQNDGHGYHLLVITRIKAYYHTLTIPFWYSQLIFVLISLDYLLPRNSKTIWKSLKLSS